MNINEISNMSAGGKMDALIAINVIGLNEILLDNALCPYCGMEMWHGKDRSRCSNCNEWRYSPYKEYSEDISAAWEVVEKVEWMSITKTQTGSPNFLMGLLYFVEVNGYVIYAETAPLAICRSALLAIMKL